MLSDNPDAYCDLSAAKLAKDQILEGVHTITRDLFTAFENEYTVFAPMSNCFEVYGLDFMVNNDCSVHLLEVNPGPDFKQTGGRLRKVIVDLWEQTCSLIVDAKAYGNTSDNTSDSESLKLFAPDFSRVYSKEWSASQHKGGMTFK